MHRFIDAIFYLLRIKSRCCKAPAFVLAHSFDNSTPILPLADVHQKILSRRPSPQGECAKARRRLEWMLTYGALCTLRTRTPTLLMWALLTSLLQRLDWDCYCGSDSKATDPHKATRATTVFTTRPPNNSALRSSRSCLLEADAHATASHCHRRAQQRADHVIHSSCCALT